MDGFKSSILRDDKGVNKDQLQTLCNINFYADDTILSAIIATANHYFSRSPSAFDNLQIFQCKHQQTDQDRQDFELRVFPQYSIINTCQVSNKTHVESLH